MQAVAVNEPATGLAVDLKTEMLFNISFIQQQIMFQKF
jgi:hypothetical protein